MNAASSSLVQTVFRCDPRPSKRRGHTFILALFYSAFYKTNVLKSILCKEEVSVRIGELDPCG